MVSTTSTAAAAGRGEGSSTLPRLYAPLVGLTTLMIFVQAITAGLFVNRDSQSNYDSLVTVHGVTADITWAVALVTAGYALWKVRPIASGLAWATAGLFVLAIAQTGIGHLITDKGMDWLIYVHVPLAMLIFGLAIWLSVRSALLRRQTIAAASATYPERGTGA